MHRCPSAWGSAEALGPPPPCCGPSLATLLAAHLRDGLALELSLVSQEVLGVSHEPPQSTNVDRPGTAELVGLPLVRPTAQSVAYVDV